MGEFAPYMVDLRPFTNGREMEFPASVIINNSPRTTASSNCIPGLSNPADGPNALYCPLIAMPNSIDFGRLYYRTDLLAKYGYTRPPETWDEVEAMAMKIVKGERSEGKAEMTGFVFQGYPDEGGTCNLMEWV